MRFEKRADERLRKTVPVAITVLPGATEDTDSQDQLTFAKDISLNGMHFRSEYYLSVGTELEARVRIPSGGHGDTFIAHRARVVWIRRGDSFNPYTVGIRILSTRKEDIESWRRFIAERVAAFI